ncbi:NADH-quinone oxidoreductase subunit J [Pseudochelatococcus sp. G4_1912]|uniref:NADH-quinone oxidoreductase subunit J n=1 Tax=Pseudochelatococcus sp. G4_1912 TaxID=3114288 RepID=UPI0039C5E482
MAAAAFFYLFAGICIASAFMVVAGRNPVTSVLFLILAFVNAAGLFILLGAEFLAMMLIVVYVGAVAVLFLFVVMMIDVDFAELKAGFLQYLPVGALVGIVFLIELVLVIGTLFVDPSLLHVAASAVADAPAAGVTNTQAIGQVLYTQYLFAFQAAGFVLLVSMVGAIVLTLRHKENIKRQDIGDQVARSHKTSVELKKVPSRQGV